MKERKNRDHVVIATKFTTPYKAYKDGQLHAINGSGNHKRSLKMSLRDSLAKLQTDFIDILYLHWYASLDGRGDPFLVNHDQTNGDTGGTGRLPSRK